MPRTPDRFPGERLEESLVLETLLAGEEPPDQGGVRFVDGSFSLRDNLGLFNPRASSGISEATHQTLDTLVHEIAETCSTEVIYNPVGTVASVIYWDSPSKILKIREELYTYTTKRQVGTATTVQYDSLGVEKQRLVESYTYLLNGRVASVDTVKTGSP
jgi:hypothetical protein